MPVVDDDLIDSDHELTLQFLKLALDKVIPRLENQTLIVLLGEFLGEVFGMRVEVLERNGDQCIYEFQGGYSEVGHFASGNAQETGAQHRPHHWNTVKVQPEDLLYSLEGENLFGVLAVVVLETLIRDLDQRLDDIGEVLVTVFGAFGENGIHRLIQDFDVGFALLDLLLL